MLLFINLTNINNNPLNYRKIKFELINHNIISYDTHFCFKIIYIPFCYQKFKKTIMFYLNEFII